MQSTKAVLPRLAIAALAPASILVLAIGTSVLTAVVACGEDRPEIGPAATGLPPRLPPLAPSSEPEAGSTERSAIDVGGRVVDALEQPIARRLVVIVDRGGMRFEAMTNDDGAFHAPGIARPYDLLVTPAPSGAPLVYLGLERSDPRLEVFEQNGSTWLPASQPLLVAVKLPICQATSGACWVSVVSASPSGAGGTAGSYTNATATGAYEITHSFHASPRAGETLAVHVLVGDAHYTQYAYTRLANVPARPGEPMNLGILTPVPVESGDPITLEGRATASPEAWQWTLSSQLELPGGAIIALRHECSPRAALRVPRLPGATWSVGAWVQSPPMEQRPYFSHTSQAWSGTLPLSATNVAIDLPLAPEPLRPPLEGALSRRGLGFAWRAASPGLASVALLDVKRAQHRFRAFTADAELPLRRLEALGLARLEPGDNVLDLTTTPGATVDELTQPDEHQRRRHLDHHVPGAITYQRFRFQVTP